MYDKKILSKPWQYLVLAVSIYIIVVAGQTFTRIRQVVDERRVIVNSIKKAEDENRELIKTAKALNTDTYIEDLARKRLGLVKPGEMVYKIVKQ
ncbi:MAG: septum formation initiator family protein [Candidatus Margulisiibacteriota bacterium]